MTRSPRLDQVKQGNPSPSETMMHFPPLFHISHRLKILISPYFRCFSAFPLFRENYSFPFYFFKFHPDFVKLIHFYMPYVFFVPLCFDHDAFMHHTMHVGLLDAPEIKRRKGRLRLTIRVSLVITHKFHL